MSLNKQCSREVGSPSISLLLRGSLSRPDNTMSKCKLVLKKCVYLKLRYWETDRCTRLKFAVKQTVQLPEIWDAIMLMCCHCQSELFPSSDLELSSPLDHWVTCLTAGFGAFLISSVTQIFPHHLTLGGACPTTRFGAFLISSVTQIFPHHLTLAGACPTTRFRAFLIVRRAGLMRSQQDFEWWWSVPLTSASLY